MNDSQLKAVLELEETPLYIFDLSELSDRICFLRNHLPSSVRICYAVKANPFLVREVSGLVERLEICSPGEYRICQDLGLPTEQFVISGVYKTPSLMHDMIARDEAPGLFTVESLQQFFLLYEEAKSGHKRIPVLLRLTSGNQFGLDEPDAEKLIADYQHDVHLDIRGIQYFSGTQKTSLKRLERELEYLDSFLERLQTSYGYRAQELEFGPGFPVSYFQGEELAEPEFFKSFSALLTGMRFGGLITLEIGRSIAASCGYYLTKVVDTKINKNRNYAIVDGGIHQLVYFGQFMAMKRPHVRILSPTIRGSEEEWNIFGSLCTINDVLVKSLPLPGLHVGDTLVFENTGAYCMTEGISLFLSRDLPAVVLFQCNGTPLLVRGHISTAFLNAPDYERSNKK